MSNVISRKNVVKSLRRIHRALIRMNNHLVLWVLIDVLLLPPMNFVGNSTLFIIFYDLMPMIDFVISHLFRIHVISAETEAEIKKLKNTVPITGTFPSNKVIVK